MAFFSTEPKKTGDKPIFLDDSKRRKWYFRAGTIVVAILLLVVSSLFLFGVVAATQKRTPVTYQSAIERYHYYYSAANTKKIAFTFDDGPNGQATLDIMKALKDANAPATFFFIGKRALVRPDIVKEGTGMGFDIEDHSFTHSPDVQSSYTRLALELNSTNYFLSEVTGDQIELYRPPYLLGIGIDPTINPYIKTSQDMVWAMQLGYLPVGSDIDSKDWLAATPEAVLTGLKTALSSSPNGHIMLFHDDPNTAKEMSQIVAYLKAQGYDIVPLKELLTPPSGSDFAFASDMRMGDTDLKTGGAVSKLQWFLYSSNYLDAYALSGVFDQQTKDALTAYQIHAGLVDPGNPGKIAGVLNAATRKAIQAETTIAPQTQTAAVATTLFGSSILDTFHSIALNSYVVLFPIINTTLEVAISITLVMVLVRTLVLLSLLLYRWRKGLDAPQELASERGVSILIPAYNEQENIAATLESIIRTTHKNREILVIDDGSKDNTASEVRAVIDAHKGDTIRLISVENGGKARALNIGTAVAQHDIVVVLDADAVLEPQAVAHFLPHFDNERVVAVAGRVRTTNSSNLLDMFQTLEYAIGQNIDKTAFSTINAIGVVPGPAGAWRKSFLQEVGGFHTDTLVEDQEMTLTALDQGKIVRYEPRAIAYTETPHSVKDFLKQRFRWVYGTMQCFWKYKSAIVRRPLSSESLVVMPNIFVYNIVLPLTYPFADSALIFGLIFGEWGTLVLPFLIFTLIDLIYAVWGLRGELNKWKLLLMVPLQRVAYRQLLYYTVYKGLIRAIEGSGMGWNKFTKSGETRRFYLAAMGGLEAMLQKSEPTPIAPEPAPAPMLTTLQLPQLMGEDVTVAFQGPSGTAPASTNLHEVMSLSAIPRHFQSAGETSSPAFSPNVLTGLVEEPNTYAKSSSLLGPTSSH